MVLFEHVTHYGRIQNSQTLCMLFIIIDIGKLETLTYYIGLIDCCLTSSQQYFSNIVTRNSLQKIYKIGKMTKGGEDG